MRKAVFAGAVALAMVGPLSVSEDGLGPAPAVAQEGPAVAHEGPAVVVTEGKIARLRAAIREQRQTDGWVHKVRDRVSGYAGSAMALQQAYAAAGPLISSLDEQQRQSGRNALRQMGGASLF